MRKLVIVVLVCCFNLSFSPSFANQNYQLKISYKSAADAKAVHWRLHVDLLLATIQRRNWHALNLKRQCCHLRSHQNLRSAPKFTAANKRQLLLGAGLVRRSSENLLELMAVKWPAGISLPLP